MILIGIIIWYFAHTQISKNQPTFPVVFLFHQLQLYVGM